MPQLLEDTSPSEPDVQLSLHPAPGLTPTKSGLTRCSDSHLTMNGLMLVTFTMYSNPKSLQHFA
ncbi:hypothetical protein QUB33_21885 [Microcoleus sp. B3-A4]|uniref:hypothetical protein n=1 Tax=Microcoleus sp. B3-A4 TaxID=2818653 RepID=UPI002FD34E7A